MAGMAAVPAGAAAAADRRPATGASHGRGRGPRVRTGSEMLIDSGYEQVRGQRTGLITNPTGILPNLRHEVDVMAASDEIDLVAVFGPEHGFRGTQPPGDDEGNYTDPRTGLPIYDTYGKTPDELADTFDKAGVDTVMFDIQDVGARFYTYIWTMYDCMRGAAKANKRFVVLDRPNPTTGVGAYGPVLHEEYATFVGREAISQQHGMTVGELARLFNAEFVPDEAGRAVELSVVEMHRYRRRMSYADTGLPWVMPSPNMPTIDTALVYPGTCMFEGTNISEGRGTTRPFELIGAPYIDYRWADDLARTKVPGADFREAYFQPMFSKHEGKTCAGVQLYITDHAEFDAVHAGIAMLVTAHRRYSKFAWRRDSWDEEHPYWIDKLTGSEYVRTTIDAGADAAEVVAGWQRELARFRKLREQQLIYR